MPFLREKRKQGRKNPAGKRIRRDAWLSPLRLKPDKLCDDAEIHAEGVRSSDRGFLNVDWEAYWELLRWTAKQSVDGMSAKVPKSLAKILGHFGIDVKMWRDLVWHWSKFFGKASCIGSPESMREHARQTGRQYHRGQAIAVACFD
ncbi:hypothetical protein [Rhodopirellula sp. MGV]|uniref:hypothetical protein n=1 Tax=Rhodopirellula sp. MGV TaxID=2023130 RepID=UPI000B97276C|nr:hypothetical protein [Rhodopirellula sp. MGV]OYP38046.1 hypothetical protein CGZ80_03690 [Rhodopirellula sp. MGV]PNY36158.1 hypothetical protein C2E31_14600 [Rhodopirellula baltica]